MIKNIKLMIDDKKYKTYDWWYNLWLMIKFIKLIKLMIDDKTYDWW
jgi:hypothetical protein